MPRDIRQVVRDLCLWLPEATESLAHGSATFRVRKQTFATFTVNHHGDQRVALLLNLPAGAQETHVTADPEHFFVPPYVGSRGWVGVELDRGLPWSRVAALVREAYVKVAPRDLRDTLPKTPVIKPPTHPLTAAQIDPLQSKRGAAVLELMRRLCLALPQTSEVRQFGQPVWKAGKKTFALVRADQKRLLICVWVGVERQGLMTADRRFSVPSYIGHNGWIGLDAGGKLDAAEIRALILDSYQHFALRGMRQALAAAAGGVADTALR